MRDTLATAVKALLVLAGAAVLGYGCLKSHVNSQLEECEDTFAEWVMKPDGTPMPSLLEQEWCSDHLVGP